MAQFNFEMKVVSATLMKTCGEEAALKQRLNRTPIACANFGSIDSRIVPDTV